MTNTLEKMYLIFSH